MATKRKTDPVKRNPVWRARPTSVGNELPTAEGLFGVLPNEVLAWILDALEPKEAGALAGTSRGLRLRVWGLQQCIDMTDFPNGMSEGTLELLSAVRYLTCRGDVEEEIRMVLRRLPQPNLLTALRFERIGLDFELDEMFEEMEPSRFSPNLGVALNDDPNCSRFFEQLKQFPNLEVLDLHGTFYAMTKLDFSPLLQLSRLVSLTVRRDGDSIDPFLVPEVPASGPLPRLRILDLDSHISSTFWVWVVEHFGDSLEHLDFSTVTLDDDTLLRTSHRLPLLKEASTDSFEGVGMDALGHFLSCLPSLNRLQLSCHSPQELSIVLGRVNKLSRLATLDFSAMTLDARELVTQLSPLSHSLSELSFSDCSITDEDLVAMAEDLFRSTPNLKKLKIRGCEGVTQRGIARALFFGNENTSEWKGTVRRRPYSLEELVVEFSSRPTQAIRFHFQRDMR